ncbi:MAG: flagellar export chaperone FliS [Ruminococcus sp.]|jgi:flagellar protein FliS|nr:flagellar export chaperone FliS [Ruminococcus sp.]
MTANPYMQYKKAASVTMTPIELLVALYDKCIIETRKAIEYIGQGNFIKAGNSISHTERIIDEFRFALDMKYEISSSLKQLYVWMKQVLINANIKKDTKALEELIPFFTELRDSFAEASKIAQTEGTYDGRTYSAA